MTARAASREEMARICETAPPETALLTREQVAAWLQVGVNTVYRLNLPFIMLGKQNVRYSVRQILDFLERRAA